MKDKDLNSEIIESTLISYAKRSIPGLSRSNPHHSPSSTSEAAQRELVEKVITNMPLEKTSGANTARFLFRLLRTMNILKESEAARYLLERKIAAQLEEAALDDLLMPSYSYLVERLYDVESVERILGYYLEEERSPAAVVRSPGDEGSGGLRRVGRLVDGYLAEIASDANLRAEKLCELAMALPDHARVYDDGLYRAADLYLKAHQRTPDEERDKVCGVMDCRKLTLEACTHAAQNERLPLCAVVQVLFFEQLQLRHAITGTLIAANAQLGAPQQDQDHHRHSGSLNRHCNRNTWRSPVRENQVLRLDMDSMRSRVQKLEREWSSMRRVIEKVDRKSRTWPGKGDSGRSSVRSKFGCRFGTKVCDSQERTVMEPRKSQTEHQQTP